VWHRVGTKTLDPQYIKLVKHGVPVKQFCSQLAKTFGRLIVLRLVHPVKRKSGIVVMLDWDMSTFSKRGMLENDFDERDEIKGGRNRSVSWVPDNRFVGI
jgi:hypothetical protein